MPWYHYVMEWMWIGDDEMEDIVIASEEQLEDIVSLRIEMQMEDWNTTLNQDFSYYADPFANITRKHIQERLNHSIYFALLYRDGEAAAMCAVEELSELPQITMCTGTKGKHGRIVSAYTRPEFRGRGYQQALTEHLLGFAREKNFIDITLTTSTPDAAHIYEKSGFHQTSSKYFLEL